MDESKFTENAKQTLHAYGENTQGFRTAHKESKAFLKNATLLRREEREEDLKSLLASGATVASGAGDREKEIEPDPFRLCFEVDLDRIKYSTAFRRLAGKCQVFVAAAELDDHLRNRLTHAVEVAQVAVAIARALNLNTVLTEAIALGHDCGHGPTGHASEDAFSLFLPEGYDHAVYGSDVILKPLNLCSQTLDGIRNHSWKRPAPCTPEGEIVSWADRIAYSCHDFDDAQRAGVLSSKDLPRIVLESAGALQSSQIDFFIMQMLQASSVNNFISMTEEGCVVLDAFRKFNYERIYLRPASIKQSAKAITLLKALVEHFADAPYLIPDSSADLSSRELPASASLEAYRAAVQYVSGMTDRFALRLGRELLGFSSIDLPRGV